MPASDTSAPIAASEPTDRSVSPQNPVVEKFANSTESNVGPSKGRKPAWNVPSGTASPESACPVMGAATWPALAAKTSSRASPKSSSTASSSSSSAEDLKSLSDASAVSVPAVRKSISSPETMVVPALQQPRPNPTANLMRRGSTGSENTHSPQPNNRSSRWVHGPNRRGNNNNNNNNNHHHHHNNNNSGGGYRGRDRWGANWSSSGNNSPRPPYFYRGNQAMTPPQPQPPVSYGYGVPAYPAYYNPMGYEYHYAMHGNVPLNVQQWVTPMAPGYSAEVLEQRNAILKQIEYYFSTENLCKDTYLRKNMDEQGWVPISLIANFNRVKQLTSDLQLIQEILNDSTVVEIQGNKLRKRDNWMTWILPLKDLTIGPATANSSKDI